MAGASPGGSAVKSACSEGAGETWVTIPGWEDRYDIHLENPWTENPGRLESVVTKSWTRLKRLSTHACTHIMRPTSMYE